MQHHLRSPLSRSLRLLTCAALLTVRQSAAVLSAAVLSAAVLSAAVLLTQPVRAQAPQPEPPRAVESTPAEVKPAEARSPQAKSPEAKSPEAKPAEAKSPPSSVSKPPPTESKPAVPRRRAGPAATAGPRPGLADTVVLRDGTKLRGTLLRVEPGNYVLLLGIEGVRTIPWRVVERVDSSTDAEIAAGNGSSAVAVQSHVSLLAPCCADEGAEDSRRAPEAAWADVSLGWDLRAEGVALFKRYTVADRGVWYSGQGFGAGASLSLHLRGPAWLGAGSAARWAELELGASNSLHTVSWKEGAELETEFLQNQSSLIVGAHFASGRWSEAGRPIWSGLVFGVAWVPTYVRFFGSRDFDPTGAFHPAGLRMTVDWGRVSPGRKGRMPGIRAFITWLPYVGQLPTAVSFGLGTVFY
ncbi:MAG: hypothetical protein RL033_4224 [Pseudomonadota bacterium]